MHVINENRSESHKEGLSKLSVRDVDKLSCRKDNSDETANNLKLAWQLSNEIPSLMPGWAT